MYIVQMPYIERCNRCVNGHIVYSYSFASVLMRLDYKERVGIFLNAKPSLLVQKYIFNDCCR